MSLNVQEKEKLPTLNKQTKALEDEQIRFSNENRGIANYACSLKPKKVKPSEQNENKRTNGRFDIERDNKK